MSWSGEPPASDVGVVPEPLPPARMQPQTVLLIASGVASLALLALITLLPVPYALLSPGPVFNTLGTYADVPMISVEGHRTYPTSGRLDLTTVSVSGGPNGPVSLLSALRAWLSPNRLVVPVEDQFPPGRTPEEEEEENLALMVSSQESATAAALTELGIDFTMTLRIGGVDEDVPAAEVLRPGDVIVAVDGQPTTDLTVLRDQVQRVEPGEVVTVTVVRDGERMDVDVETVAGGGRTILGVVIDPTFEFPFEVKITIDNVGGPSAGTMFALGIIDTLTPGKMTGGSAIAGTGTMDVDGRVGGIGGIQQKLVGARAAGASWFLAPEANCPEVVGHVPEGLHVVKIATLAQARDAVEAIAADGGPAGATADLPTCTR